MSKQKIIIGCDPDSSKSGFAFFVNGKIKHVECMGLMHFYNYLLDGNLPTITFRNVELHIENVKGTSSAFTGMSARQPLSVKMKIAQKVGMCKQVQTEIERIADRFGIKVVRHGLSSMWKDSKKGKAALADLGWHGKSNEDSRSAAYFGYLGVKQST